MAARSYLLHESVAEGKRLGRHVEHDPRSLLFRLTRAPKIASVAHERLIPVLDQGDLGSCTGNAQTGALGSAPLYAALPAAVQKALDEKYAVGVYSDATKLDDAPGQYKPDDTGSSGLAVMKVAKARGLIAGYTTATSPDEMVSVLQSAPVIIGIPWFAAFDEPRAGDALVTIGGAVRGGHEVVVNEWDQATDTFTAVNSWGPGWGDAGRFRFTGHTMAALFQQQADAYAAVPADQPAPAPAPVGGVWPAAVLDPWLAKKHSGQTNAVAAALIRLRTELGQA